MAEKIRNIGSEASILKKTGNELKRRALWVGEKSTPLTMAITALTVLPANVVLGTILIGVDYFGGKLMKRKREGIEQSGQLIFKAS